jgi:hypothetical protein
VLDVVSLDEDAGLVPLPNGTERLVLGRGHDVVEGGRLAVRTNLRG